MTCITERDTLYQQLLAVLACLCANMGWVLTNRLIEFHSSPHLQMGKLELVG